MKKKLFFFMSLMISVISFAQTTYYVKSSIDGGDDSNDGLSWNTAFATLSKASTIAASGSEIRIATGTFNVTAPVKDELTGKTLTIKGGYDVASGNQDYNNKTVFDGNEGATNQLMMITGGAATKITLDNVKVQNCKTAGSGGAINILYGNLNVSNSIFHNNKAAASLYTDGGAINNAGTLQVVNCVFTSNAASRYGGAIANGAAAANVMSVTNSSFSGNFAQSGGGIGVRASGTSNVNNSIFWNNTHSSAGSGAQLYTEGVLKLDHNIVKGGSASISLVGTGATLTLVNSSDVTDAINSDPLFASTTDLSIQAGSPAIDKGSNALIPGGITIDIIGEARVYNSVTVDLGAYEYTPGTETGLNDKSVQFTIYPNPTKDFVIVELAHNNSTRITISDITGKTIIDRITTGKEFIDVSFLNKGIYLIKVNNSASKIIVE